MTGKIYLLGGGNQDVFRDIDKKILNESTNKKIFIINLTTPNKEKLEKKKIELMKHFKEVGYEEIDFASDCNSREDIKERVDNAGALFIAGGDTEFLLENIKEKNLAPLIKSFKGIIGGNSAGAYACCKEYIKIKDNKIKIIPSLGLVDFCCKAHYKENFDKVLLDSSQNRKIYGIPEASVIIWSGGELEIIGEAYLFSNKQKEKLK